jgi:hypothetical protein
MDVPPNRNADLTPIRAFEPAPLRVPETEDSHGSPGRTPTIIDARLRYVERRLISVISSLNNATIEAVCNEDGTITVTLTLPALPAQ